MYKVYEIKQRVFESNEQLANTLRADLKREKALDTMIDLVTSWVAAAGYLGVFALMFLENLFPPIPSELIMAASGFAAARGQMSLFRLIVFAVAGKTGEGVFEAAAETGNFAIGVDSDQKYINPDVILCSMVKQVGKSIYDTVADMDANFKGGQIWTADMATGYIDVAYGDDTMTQQVSDELKAEVEDLKAKIVSGEIEVPTALK